MSQRSLGGQFCNLPSDDFLSPTLSSLDTVPNDVDGWKNDKVFHQAVATHELSGEPHGLVAALQDNGEMKIAEAAMPLENDIGYNYIVTSSKLKMYFPSKIADAALRLTLHGRVQSGNWCFGVAVGDMSALNGSQNGYAPLAVLGFDTFWGQAFAMYPNDEWTGQYRTRLCNGCGGANLEDEYHIERSGQISNFDLTAPTVYELGINVSRNDQMYSLKYMLSVNSVGIYQYPWRLRLGPIAPWIPGGECAMDQLRIFIGHVNAGVDELGDFRLLGVQMA